MSGAAYSMTARTSFWERISSSSSSSLNSVPAYFWKGSSAPTETSIGSRRAVVQGAARADGQDRPLLGALLGGVRQDDAALGHLLPGAGLDDQAVAEGLELVPMRPWWP